MKYQMYSIFDRAANLFMQPSIDVNEATAKRNFAMAVNQANGALNFKSSDFDLYRVGTFTDNTGAFECETPFEFVCNGENVYGE